MIWKPIDVEPRLPSLGKHSSFFLQQLPDLCLLFKFEADLTFLLVTRTESNRLIVDCIKRIKSERSVLKIIANNDCVIMLDIENELFYLQGTLDSSGVIFNAENAKKFLTGDAVLSWQRQQQFMECLTMTGISNAVSFLYFDESVYAALYASDDLKNGLKMISQSVLDGFSKTTKYFSVKLTGNLANIVGERIFKKLTSTQEVVFVLEETKMFFILPLSDGQIISRQFQIYFQSNEIINVMSFEKKSLILIVCKSGKMVCLRFDNSTKFFNLQHAWLPEKVTGVVGYEDEMINVLWSDFNRVFMATVDDENDVRMVKVFHNLKRVKHFVKIDDNILAITLDGCLYVYEFFTIPSQEIQYSGADLMSKLFESSKLGGKLTKEISRKENLIEALNISKKLDESKNILVTKKDDIVTVENRTEHSFRKELWRLCLGGKDSHRKHMEVVKLENDIPPGGSITVKCDKKSLNSAMLVCDIFDQAISIDLEFERQETIDYEPNYVRRLNQCLKKNASFMA